MREMQMLIQVGEAGYTAPLLVPMFIAWNVVPAGEYNNTTSLSDLPYFVGDLHADT